MGREEKKMYLIQSEFNYWKWRCKHKQHVMYRPSFFCRKIYLGTRMVEKWGRSDMKKKSIRHTLILLLILSCRRRVKNLRDGGKNITWTKKWARDSPHYSIFFFCLLHSSFIVDSARRIALLEYFLVESWLEFKIIIA